VFPSGDEGRPSNSDKTSTNQLDCLDSATKPPGTAEHVGALPATRLDSAAASNTRPPFSPTSCNSKKPSREGEPDAPGRISRRTGKRYVKLTLSQRLTKDATMPRVKQAAKHARTTNAAAVTALGAAGLGLSLTGSASANTIPTADFPQSDNIPPNQRFVLGEEEMADVSLATFYLFDKENAGSDMQLAAVVVRRGCRGCGGCRGCRGCAVRGCGGCGCAGCGGCCARWGRCRIC